MGAGDVDWMGIAAVIAAVGSAVASIIAAMRSGRAARAAETCERSMQQRCRACGLKGGHVEGCPEAS